jgi:O-acetyl-ADP-ribose deacetylase
MSKQRSHNEILREETSDHLPQQFKLKVDQGSNPLEVKVATWNLLFRCNKKPDPNGFPNNPWDHEELFDKDQDKDHYEIRKKVQKGKIKDLALDSDIICLQETHNYSPKDLQGLCNELNKDGKKWKFVKTTKNGRNEEGLTGGGSRHLTIIYDSSKYNAPELSRTLPNTKEDGTTIFCGLEATFQESSGDKRKFVVQNCHMEYGKAGTLMDAYCQTKKNIPTITVGDMNEDQSTLGKSGKYAVVSCGQATNFDVPQGTKDKDKNSYQETESKCYDMAFISNVPKDASVTCGVKGKYFDQKLESHQIENVVTIQRASQKKSLPKVSNAASVNTISNKTTEKPAASKYPAKSNSASHSKTPNSSKARVQFLESNILKMKVDAVVNAGNEDLSMGSGAGGLSGAFHEDIGADVLAKNLIASNGKNKTLQKGQVVAVNIKQIQGINADSKLKKNEVQHIIHTFGPNCNGITYSDHKDQLDKELEIAYKAAFDKALEVKARTIAIPPLSIGIFSFPKDEAAKIIAKVLHEYEGKFEQIIFCSFPKEGELNIIEEVKRIYEGRPLSNKSQTVTTDSHNEPFLSDRKKPSSDYRTVCKAIEKPIASISKTSATIPDFVSRPIEDFNKTKRDAEESDIAAIKRNITGSHQVAESKTFTSIPKDVNKAIEIIETKYSAENISEETKQEAKKEVKNRAQVFDNKLARALHNLTKKPEDSKAKDGVENTWKNLTTLDRRVLVDFYNQNNSPNIDFNSLYKDAGDKKSELSIKDKDYIFDSEKIADVTKIIKHATKSLTEIPKNKVSNPVTNKFIQESKTQKI